MLQLWWAGAFGAFKKRRSKRASASSSSPRAQESMGHVALVVGSTGIVGDAFVEILQQNDTPGGPWKVYAVSRRALPPWYTATTHLEPADLDDPAADVTHIHLDLADHAAVAEHLKALTDITHVFYVAWAPRATEAEAREVNCAMLRNVLAVVVPNCPKLVHVCIQTSRKHCIDPFESLSTIPRTDRHYSEDLPRLDYPDLEDVLLDGIAFREGAVTWSVHRPTTIFGFSPRSSRNVIASLCVYAAICRKEGVKLRWPGSRVAWEGLSDASDAELVAEQALWAALEPFGKDAPFNCSNGDVFKWKQLWPMLASHFDVEWSGYEGEDQRFKLEDAMAGKAAVWAEIVSENELVVTELDEVASWSFVDDVFDVEVQNLDTMNKSKEYGFLGFRNTVRSFSGWIEKMKVKKIVP